MEKMMLSIGHSNCWLSRVSCCPVFLQQHERLQVHKNCIGSYGHIAKPIHVEELFALIAELVE